MIKYKIQTAHWIILTLIMSVFTVLLSCEQDDLDIREDFPFEVLVMPVPKEIAKGETVEIRIRIKPEGNFKENKYYLRYFQFDGKGALGYLKGKPFKPNDQYNIPDLEFRLYYRSESTVSQSFDVWFSDSFGNEQKENFQFNSVN